MVEKVKGIAKAMSQAHLYTVTIAVYETQEVFIDQVYTTTTNLDRVLYAWVEQAVARGFIKGTADPQIAFQDVVGFDNRLEPLENVFNAWRIEFTFGQDLYVKDALRAQNDGIFDVDRSIYITLDFIKTSTSESLLIPSHTIPLGPNDSSRVRQAETKYLHYQQRFEHLKGIPALSRSVDEEREYLERWMRYWDARRKFCSQFYNRDDNDEENSSHMIMMYYRGGTYLRQFVDMPDSDVKFILLIWANSVFQNMHKSKIIAPQDRVILMEKLSQDIYTPLPVEGSKNVWGTHCSLSEGMAKLFVVKTALEDIEGRSWRSQALSTWKCE